MSDTLADLGDKLKADAPSGARWGERWWRVLAFGGTPERRDGGARKRFAYRDGKVVEIGFDEFNPFWP